MASSVPKSGPLVVYYPRPSEPSSSKSYSGSKLLNDSYDYFQLILQCFLYSLNSTSYLVGSAIGALKPVAEKYNFNTTPVKLDSDENKKVLSQALIIDHEAKPVDPRRVDDKPSSYFAVYLIHCGLVLAINTTLNTISPNLASIMTAALAAKYSNDLSQRAVRWLSAPPAKKKPFVLNALQ